MRNLIIVLVVLLFLTIAVAYLISNGRAAKTEVDNTGFITPSPSIVPRANLTFDKDNIYIKNGIQGSVSINIMYQGIVPDFVQIELAYDPEVLTDISLTPGSFFNKPIILLESIDESIGRISYAVRSGNTQASSIYAGEAIILNFRVLSRTAEQSSIYFLPKTSAAVKDKNIAVEYSKSLNILIEKDQNRSLNE